MICSNERQIIERSKGRDQFSIYLMSSFALCTTSCSSVNSPWNPLVCAKPVIPGLTRAANVILFHDHAKSPVMDGHIRARANDAHMSKADIEKSRHFNQRLFVARNVRADTFGPRRLSLGCQSTSSES